MKTKLLIINIVCLLSLSVLGQDTLTIVYKKHKTGKSNYMIKVQQELQQQEAFLKKATQTVVVKEIEVPSTVFDTLSFDNMLKVDGYWINLMSHSENCLDTIQYCCRWTVVSTAEYRKNGQTFTYFLEGKNLPEEVHNFLTHQQQVHASKDFSPLTGLQPTALFYTTLNFSINHDLQALVKKAKKFVKQNLHQKIKVTYPIKKVLVEKIAWKTTEVLQLYGNEHIDNGKAFLVDSHTGLLLKEFDLSEFEKKQ